MKSTRSNSVFFYIACTLTLPANGIGSEKALQEALKNHAAAFEQLDNHRNSMALSHWTEYCGNTTIYHYDYYFASDGDKQIYLDYKNAYDTLSHQIFIHALGDGFIMGILAAVVNRAVNKDKLPGKKMTAGIIASIIGMILYQNKKIGQVPCYSYQFLDKYANLFANCSFYTIGRVLCALTAAGAGFFGTDYTLTTLADLLLAPKNSALADSL